MSRQALNLKRINTCLKLVNGMHIREFQEMMRRLYFHRDSKRGVEGTYNWLKDELEELGKLLKRMTDKKQKKSLQMSLLGLRR